VPQEVEALHTINLTGWRVVVAGGDARDVALAESLQKLGAGVWLLGFSEFRGKTDRFVCSTLPESADVLILPLPGLDEDGYIYAPFTKGRLHISHYENLLKPGLLLIAGRMPVHWQEKLESKLINVVLTAELDELAVLNAIPTAEGAVELAMRESETTVSGSQALVTGFGRCGLPLATLLAAMGATVTVAARRRDVLALAESMRFQTVRFESLPGIAKKFDLLFNTVPAMVLTEQVISEVKQHAIIIDIASSPGGTDFYAAERRGVKSFLALGLPGKVAPMTAGKILAKVYPIIISSHGKGGEQE
jgi:dipicolinate synthase subunit A